MTNTPHIKYQHAQLGWDNNSKQFQKSIVSAEFLTLILTVNFWQKITNVMCFNESAHVTVNTFWNSNMKDCCCNLESHRWELTLWVMFTRCHMCVCAMRIHPKTAGPHKSMLFSRQIVKWQLLGYRPLLGNVKYSADRRKIYQFLTFWSQKNNPFLQMPGRYSVTSAEPIITMPPEWTELWIMKYTMTGKITAREMLMWKTLLSVQHEQTES